MTALVISSLPAWETKAEVLASLLSHLVTKGTNYSTLGLVRPRGRPR